MGNVGSHQTQLKDNYGSTCRIKDISRIGMRTHRVDKNQFLRPKSEDMRSAVISDPLRVGSRYFSWRCGDTFPINDPNQSPCMGVKHDVSRRQIRVMNSARSEDSVVGHVLVHRWKYKGDQSLQFPQRIHVICRDTSLSQFLSRERRIMHQVPKLMHDLIHGALSSIKCALIFSSHLLQNIL